MDMGPFTQINLANPLLVYPGECVDVRSKVVSVDPKYKYQWVDLAEVQSDVPSYFYNGTSLQPFGENWWRALLGSRLIFQAEYGGRISYNYGNDGNVYPIAEEEGLTFPMIQLYMSTNANQNWHVDQLLFEVESDYDEPLNLLIEGSENHGADWSAIVGQEMQVPSNGIFAIDMSPWAGEFGFGKSRELRMRIASPVSGPGKVKISLIDIESDAEIILDAHSKWDWETPFWTSGLEEIVYPKSVEVEFVDPIDNIFVKSNFWSQTKYSFWDKWHSKYDVGESIYGFDFWIDYPGDLISEYMQNFVWPVDPPIPSDEDLKKVNLSDLDLYVDGDFESLDLKVEIDKQGQWSTELVTVEPGDTISFELGSLSLKEGNNSVYLNISLENYPEIPQFMLENLQITPQPVTATNHDSEKTLVVVDTFVEDDDGNKEWDTIEFLYPIPYMRVYILGQELMYLTAAYNSPIQQVKKISQMGENEQVTMNHSCFNVIGEVDIKKIIYQHDEHDQQPFDKVILHYDNTDIFLPTSGWSVTEAVFEPAPAIEKDHNGLACFELRVEGPEIPIDNAFFDLVGIEAVVDETEVFIPVISNVNTKAELSVADPVKGTKTKFKE